MKKIIAIVMTALMLLAVLAPASSATTTSPVKKYADAKPGELLYTVDFNGNDGAITLGSTGANDKGQMDYTVIDNGAGVKITNKTGATRSVASLWGGLIKDLEATNQTIYSMVYKAKADEKYGSDNSVAVGGWAVSEAAFASTSGIYNNYSSHNTLTSADGTEKQRTALSNGVTKIGQSLGEPGDGYVYVKDMPAIDVDADGFLTALVVYNGTTKKFANYYLKAGATNLNAEASWIKFDEREMTAALDGTNTNYMCFWTYTFYDTINTTIKNVQYYKEYLWSLKKYDDAKPGDLLYTINFNGDAAFTPGIPEASDEYTDYTISPDGSAVTIKSKQGAADKKFNLWGGLIKDLPATNETIYSMVYRAKANGESDVADTAKNNSVGVGGWAISETAFNTKTSGIYNVYSNHNTKQLVDGTAVNYSGQRTALSDGITKLGNAEQPNTGYVKVSEVGATLAEDADGFVTVLLVFDGTKAIPTIANYYLKDGATDLKNQASWVKFDERPMTNALLPGSTETEYMCFWTYAHYNVIDTTIKDVEYYKEYLWSDPNATVTPPAASTPTTTAPTTTAPTTEAPETTAATTTKPATTTAAAEEEKGCGGTITVAGIALVASLGTCAVYVEKKRRK